MSLIYTQGALADLADIYDFLRQEWPDVLDRFEQRLTEIETRISEHPQSSNELINRPGVYAVAFVRYPYRLFYRITDDQIEVLHLYHTARRIMDRELSDHSEID